MKEIVDSYFQRRSLVNHQLMSYNDTILGGEGRKSRMEKIVRNIRVGTDEPIELIPGGKDGGGAIKLDVLEKEIYVRLKGLRLGNPTIREANGAEHPATPLECRIRKLTYFSPIYMDFVIYRDDITPEPGQTHGSIEESSVPIGNLPIMVRSCLLYTSPSPRALSTSRMPSSA